VHAHAHAWLLQEGLVRGETLQRMQRSFQRDQAALQVRLWDRRRWVLIASTSARMRMLTHAAACARCRPVKAEVDAVGRAGPFTLRHGYRKPCASGRDVFDVPGSQLLVGEHPEVFLAVLESPRVMELVLEIIGEDVSAVEYSARTVPPDGEGGYTEWQAPPPPPPRQ
jgi:hypothetical protein